MATPKSPFWVLEDFLSPKICEHVVDKLGMYTPDFDAEDNPMFTSKSHDKCQDVVYENFTPWVPAIEQHYDFKHTGTERMQFEFLTPGVEPNPHCENSKYIEKKWAKVYNREFTCVVFLSDYQDQPPFDVEFEVYGGKLEFPQHHFGFNPQRGTMIVFPSGPHFINANAQIFAGELFQVRFHLAAAMPYIYQPKDFPGDYRTWF